jgi:hypothetical protein
LHFFVIVLGAAQTAPDAQRGIVFAKAHCAHATPTRAAVRPSGVARSSATNLTRESARAFWRASGSVAASHALFHETPHSTWIGRGDGNSGHHWTRKQPGPFLRREACLSRHFRERSYGTFVRRFELPFEADTDKVEASFHGCRLGQCGLATVVRGLVDRRSLAKLMQP